MVLAVELEINPLLIVVHHLLELLVDGLCRDLIQSRDKSISRVELEVLFLNMAPILDNLLSYVHQDLFQVLNLRLFNLLNIFIYKTTFLKDRLQKSVDP